MESLDTLLHRFEDRAASLNELLSLRGIESNDQYGAFMEALFADIVALEKDIKELRAFVRIQKDGAARIPELLQKLQAQNEALVAMQENLPAHLPGKQQQAVLQKHPELAVKAAAAPSVAAAPPPAAAAVADAARRAPLTSVPAAGRSGTQAAMSSRLAQPRQMPLASRAPAVQPARATAAAAAAAAPRALPPRVVGGPAGAPIPVVAAAPAVVVQAPPQTVALSQLPPVLQRNPSAAVSFGNGNLGIFNKITLQYVTVEEFEAIPKYVRGRLTLERINAGVDGLNRVFEEKYALLSQPLSKLKEPQRRKFDEYRAAECEACGGLCFVTEDDVTAMATPSPWASSMAAASASGASAVMAAPFRLDPTGKNIVALLRHCGRVKEVRANGLVRFVVPN